MRGLIEALTSTVFVSLLSLGTTARQATQDAKLFAASFKDLNRSGNRGLKFGDKCEETSQCDFEGSICDTTLKLCQCIPELPITNHLDKCGKAVSVNETCEFNEQCEQTMLQTECRDGRCMCRFDKTPVANKDGIVECQNVPKPKESPHRVDPAMIGILAGMALMFIILCVVLRLFSKARWRENRTIFNTPNPRLMNASLLQHNKSFHDGRRGSKASGKGPSRTTSINSLRPHSPSASLGSKNSGPRSRCNSKDENDSPPQKKSPTKGEERRTIFTPEDVKEESQSLQNA